MTVRELLKLVEPEHQIEIVDVDEPGNENSLFDGRKEELKKLGKKSYLSVLSWHAEEVAAFSSILVLFVAAPKDRSEKIKIAEELFER